jgi:hypothetical protein
MYAAVKVYGLWSSLFFCCFYLIINFVLLNLLIAIFVEGLFSSHKKASQKPKPSSSRLGSQPSDSNLFHGLPEASIPEKFKILPRQRSSKGYRWRALAKAALESQGPKLYPTDSIEIEIPKIEPDASQSSTNNSN